MADNHLVAKHRRCWGKEHTEYDPVHYLALLERKPGALDFARPLDDWNLPGCFDLLRRRLEAQLDHKGTREYIKVLRLLEKASIHELAEAVDLSETAMYRVCLLFSWSHPNERSYLSETVHDERTLLKMCDVPGPFYEQYRAAQAIRRGEQLPDTSFVAWSLQRFDGKPLSELLAEDMYRVIADVVPQGWLDVGVMRQMIGQYGGKICCINRRWGIANNVDAILQRRFGTDPKPSCEGREEEDSVDCKEMTVTSAN